MTFPGSTKNASITFSSIEALTDFKKECTPSDFYVERDALRLVGSFTEEQLQIADLKYAALFVLLKE